MRKLIALIFVASVFTFASCGKKAEEAAATDSTTVAPTEATAPVADSTAAASTDSTAAKTDSAAAAPAPAAH